MAPSVRLAKGVQQLDLYLGLRTNVRMNRLIRPLIAFTIALASCPAKAGAQDSVPQQWLLERVTEKDAIVATASFDNGLTIVARCDHDVFDLLIVGLPEASASEVHRSLALLVGEQTREKAYFWTVASDRTAAFSRVPGVLARQLARGGTLQIILPAPAGGRRTRYVMGLEPSGEAVNETLTHCGWPVFDPRDELLLGDGLGPPGNIMWKTLPQAQFPGQAAQNGITDGSVTLNCILAADGKLDACRIESEHPRGYGFGREALRSVGQARMRLTDTAQAEGVTMTQAPIVFAITYRVQ